MKLYNFNKVAEALLARMVSGFHFHQQFLCAKCGVKQTMAEPDILYKTGKCEECGHITDIEKDGCNYMLVSSGISDLILRRHAKSPSS